MKKLLGLTLGIVLLGAGCMGGGSTVAEGPWTLAFDMPDNWGMYAPYTDVTFPGADIEKMDSEVWLQNSTETMSNDTLLIKVIKLDKRRIIPSEAEDLGDGFFKDSTCPSEDVCAPTYYMQTEELKYKFKIELNGHNESEASSVILSAEEVLDQE